MKIFVLVFSGIGVILLAIAGVVYMGEAKFLATAQQATGTVTDLDLSGGSDNSTAYCPVIEFTTSDGQPVRFYGNVCSSPPSYNIGDTVQIFYDPQNLDKVQMSGFWAHYTGVIVLSCIGFPFFLFGLSGLFMGRKKEGS